MRLRLFATFILLTSFAFAQQATQRRILRPVSNAAMVRLPGTVHPRIANASDQGAASPTLPLERMTMVFSRTAAQQAALDQLLAEQQDPSSANYHKWLTPEEFGDRFGLAQADIDTVSAWLTAQGFTVDEVARARNWIAFSGIAAQVEAAFRAPIHNYLVGGKTHFAASTDVAIPDAFSGVVSGVTGLHDFAPHALNVKPRPHVTSSITGNHFIVPGDFATIYNLPSYTNGVPCTGNSGCLDGTGQTVAIVGQSQLSTDSNPGRNGTPGVNGQQYDVVTFRNLAGLPPVNLTVKLKGSDPGIVSGDAAEANLDVEWSGAAAPNAALIYYLENSNNGGAFQALTDAVNDNAARIISVSYGTCEAQLTSSTQSQLTTAGQQANAQGQAIVVASGDSGAADCDANLPATHGLSVDFPSSMPYATSIGGTTFTGDTTNSADPTQPTQYWAGSTNDVSPSAFSYIPEIVWNDTSGVSTGAISATGGGASVKFPKPSWQTGPGVPADGARDIPDISLNAAVAHDQTVICSQSSCVNNYRNTDTTYDVIGGTSIGTPQFAGILALINQAKGSAQGNINPQLYSLATSAPWVFNDITSGNNIVTCTGGTGCSGGSLGYSAGPGYDLVTGLGSIDATALLNAYTGNPNPHFLVLPASRSLSFTLTSNSIVALSVTPKEGFTGNVALTCTLSSSLAGATCSFDNSTVPTPGSANLTVGAGTITTSATGTVTVTGMAGSTTNSVVINVSVGTQDFQLTSGNTTETVTQGGSTTDTVTVTSLLGFSSSVSLTCTGSTGLTCSLSPSSVTPTSSTPATSTLTVTAAGNATSGTVTVTGASGSLTHNRPIAVTVNTAPADFTLTVASPVVSIPSGTPITDQLTVAALGSFNSNVALTCSVPSSLGTTSCSINPTTVTGGSGTALVTIQGAVLTRDRGAPLLFNRRGLGQYASLVFALGVVFTTQSSRRRDLKRILHNGILGLLLLAMMFGLPSCGGGSSSGGGGSTPTPITGNVTITGTGGGITHTITINVTVH
jgi:subtilase family serine protease